MTKTFREKILKNGTVDTKNYRYHVAQYPDHCEIRRIPLDYLNTTTAIDEWEIVEIIK